VTGPTGPLGASPHAVTRSGPVVSGEGLISSVASCHAGEHAVGGGFGHAELDLDIGVYAGPNPEDDGSTPTGWRVLSSGKTNRAFVQAFAICVPD
jgi:hypothetical protein